VGRSRAKRGRGRRKRVETKECSNGVLGWESADTSYRKNAICECELEKNTGHREMMIVASIRRDGGKDFQRLRRDCLTKQDTTYEDAAAFKRRIRVYGAKPITIV